MKLKTLSALVLASVLFSACSDPERIKTENKRNKPVLNLVATLETEPVESADDAADDAAIWHNNNAPAMSLVLATNKQVGLKVYDLKGQLKQSLDLGRLNNVDIRQNIHLNNKTIDIAIASSRTSNGLEVFQIQNNGEVLHLGTQALELPEPYGTCMHLSPGGQAYAFVNDKNGRYQQWEIASLHPLRLQLVREFRTASQPEGCVADDPNEILYVGEEAKGVWKISSKANSDDELRLVDKVGDVLVADVEGMDIYRNQERAWLLVSSQGDNSYAVYDLNNNESWIGSFRLVGNTDKNLDGTQETDGLSVHSGNFGADFPEGLVVIQDGFNRYPKANQNFKYLDWRELKQAMNRPE